MANLTKQLEGISNAFTGAEIRNPLAEAFRILNEEGKDTATLNLKDDTYYAKQSDMGSLLPFDSVPKEKSTKLVTGGGIFAIIGNMDEFDWGSDDWLI